MATLLFLAVALALTGFLIKLIWQLARRKRIRATVRWITVIVISYSLCWVIAYLISADEEVPLGTHICFDDWCATVTSIETAGLIGSVRPSGQFVILHVSMSNEARGIAQKPSEPRVKIIDDNSSSFEPSASGQAAFEAVNGHQTPLDERLELHETLGTVLVFDIPANARNCKVLIEEGPFITRLLLPQDRQVFALSK